MAQHPHLEIQSLNEVTAENALSRGLCTARPSFCVGSTRSYHTPLGVQSEDLGFSLNLPVMALCHCLGCVLFGLFSINPTLTLSENGF